MVDSSMKFKRTLNAFGTCILQKPFFFKNLLDYQFYKEFCKDKATSFRMDESQLKSKLEIATKQMQENLDDSSCAQI